MKHDIVAARATEAVTGTVPGLLSRAALAAVPLLSLGMLGAVPSLVLAFRRGTRADWLAAVVFTAVNVAWLFEAVLTPVDTHGPQYAADILLLFASTLGAALHCLFVRPSGGDAR
ncbi:hypothetical protein ACWEWI_26920 [Streptomyces sp. NPDC003753]|uniref:hypothetical protein n=1 Tax=unclassified Streptomyces TaxID=2593676 RepID=UPI0019049C1D|nr:hypothetical protein [Streptomyces sp. Y2F8-2]GHK02453.1 hypothetical protein SY2F82_42500 [Streptomyces sp. Y2F8-2]